MHLDKLLNLLLLKLFLVLEVVFPCMPPMAPVAYHQRIAAAPCPSHGAAYSAAHRNYEYSIASQSQSQQQQQEPNFINGVPLEPQNGAINYANPQNVATGGRDYLDGIGGDQWMGNGIVNSNGNDADGAEEEEENKIGNAEGETKGQNGTLVGSLQKGRTSSLSVPSMGKSSSASAKWPFQSMEEEEETDTTTTEIVQPPNANANDELLLLPHQSPASPGIRQYSIHILPVNKSDDANGKERKALNKTDDEFKHDVPLAKSHQQPIADEEAAAKFVSLDCPQNGPHNYTELLNCLEVEVKPFDGLSFVQHELPLPSPEQKCHFEEENQEKEEIEKCSFYSAEDGPLQFTLSRFHSPDLENSQKYSSVFGQLMRRPNGDMPNGNFLTVIEPEGRDPRNWALLKLDILCQQGDGRLSFNYWCTFDQFMLKVCTRMGNERHCTTQILYDPSSSLMVVQVINPSQFAKKGIANGRFSVEIIASGFHEPAILILDNLRYEAEECPGIRGEKESIAESAGGKKMPFASFGRIAEAKIFTPKANTLPLDNFADDGGRTAGREDNDDTNGQGEMFPLWPNKSGQLPSEEDVNLLLKRQKGYGQKIEVKPSEIKMENDSEEEEGENGEWQNEGGGNGNEQKEWPNFKQLKMQPKPMGKEVLAGKDAKFRREMLKLMNGKREAAAAQPNSSAEKRRTIKEGIVKIMPLNSTKKRMGPWKIVGPNEDEGELRKEKEKASAEVHTRETEKIFDRINALRKLRRLRLTAGKGAKRQKMPSTDLDNACELIQCKFTEGFCHYEMLKNGGKFRLGKWRIALPRTPNINIKSGMRRMLGKGNHSMESSGSQNGSLNSYGYAYIASEEKTSSSSLLGSSTIGRRRNRLASADQRIIHILQSPEFSLNSSSTAELSLDIFRRTNAIKFQICLDTMMNCVYEVPFMDAGGKEEEEEGNGKWQREERVELPKGTKRIFLIATQLGGTTGLLAIDNIQLKIDGQPCGGTAPVLELGMTH